MSMLKKTRSLVWLCMAGTSSAIAGGLDRTGQDLGALFESGRYLEVSVSHVSPRVRGTDLLGGRTGDVGDDYFLPSLSLKVDATERLSLALVADETFGAKMAYGQGSPMLGGTSVDVSSQGLMGLARYRLNDSFSVHGGARVQSSSAHVQLKGLAYGPVSGYQMQLRRDTTVSPVLGIAFEKREIALRFAATYHGAIKHEFTTRESAPLAPLNGSSTTAINLPRAVNLDFQTGIAADTLLFAHLRWVNWSEFRADPSHFLAVTGEGLVDLKDTRTWTLGLGRRLNDQWSAALSATYEGRTTPLSSPLSPVNGRRGITLAAIYTQDRMRVTAGISYLKLGDAYLETGTPDTLRATMSGNTTLGLGLKFGYAF